MKKLPVQLRALRLKMIAAQSARISGVRARAGSMPGMSLSAAVAISVRGQSASAARGGTGRT